MLAQIIDWRYDIPECDSTGNPFEKIENIEQDESIYNVFIYTRAFNGKAVNVKITHFRPFFYVKVSPKFNETSLEYLKEFITSSGLLLYKISFTSAHDFYGYTESKETFVKLEFYNYANMKIASNKLSCLVDINGIGKIKFKTYESNVEPSMRIMHLMNIKAAGVIEIPDESYATIEMKYTELVPVDTDLTAPFVQASFDIESFSQYILTEKVTIKGNLMYGDKESNWSTELLPGMDIKIKNQKVVINKVLGNSTLEFVGSVPNGEYSRLIINEFRAIPKESTLFRPFPEPEIESNVITCIATVFKRYLEPDVYRKTVISLNVTDEIQDADLIVVESEYELIKEWAKLIMQENPDIIYSYNGDKFDFNYIYNRAKMLDCSELFFISKTNGHYCQLKKESFTSSAYGSTDYSRMIIPGRLNFDVHIYIKRNMKFDSYKLDTVAETVLGENKHDISPSDIFDYFIEDSKHRKIIAEYCIQDTMLPQRLVDRLDILPIQIEMSNVTHVPLRYLLERGQQVKVFSQIILFANKNGFFVPHFKQLYWNPRSNYTVGDVVIYKKENSDFKMTYICTEPNKCIVPLNGKYWEPFSEEKFKGATVLNPKIGAYWKPITTLDFASLYPSIIIANNLCYSTIQFKKVINQNS